MLKFWGSTEFSIDLTSKIVSENFLLVAYHGKRLRTICRGTLRGMERWSTAWWWKMPNPVDPVVLVSWHSPIQVTLTWYFRMDLTPWTEGKLVWISLLRRYKFDFSRTIDPKPCNPRTLQKPKKGGGYPKVFLGGLPSNVTETDLRSFFTRFGKVMEVVIMYDQEKKKSRGENLKHCKIHAIIYSKLIILYHRVSIYCLKVSKNITFYFAYII